MVDRITSSLAREAILAALKDQTQAAKAIREDAGRVFEAAVDARSLERPAEAARGGRQAGDATPAGAIEGLKDGFLSVDRELRSASPGTLARDLLSGEVKDFHEVATRINRARISFEFALEIRNKLIDAYRETMRMSV